MFPFYFGFLCPVFIKNRKSVKAGFLTQIFIQNFRCLSETHLSFLHVCLQVSSGNIVKGSFLYARSSILDLRWSHGKSKTKIKIQDIIWALFKGNKIKINSQVGKTYKMGHNSLLYPEKKITKLLYSWETEVCNLLGLTVEQDLVEHPNGHNSGLNGDDYKPHRSCCEHHCLLSFLWLYPSLEYIFQGTVTWMQMIDHSSSRINFQYIFTLTVNLISNFKLQHFAFL